MWLAGCATTLLLSARRAFGSQMFAQASASDGPARLQRALDAVDPSAPPQVHLTYPQQLAGAQGGRPELASLMVMDSSFNPPTRAPIRAPSSAPVYASPSPLAHADAASQGFPKGLPQLR